MHCFNGSGYGSEMLLHPEAYSALLYSPSALFPSLTELKVDVAYLREPFVATSVTRLFVLITGKLVDLPDSVVNTLRRMPASLPNIEFLRVDGDRRIYPFTPDVARFCQALPKLQRLVLSSSVVASPLLKALSASSVLKSVRVAEYSPSDDSDAWKSPFFALSVPISLSSASFTAMSEIGFISRSTLVASRFILDGNFPSESLVHLWIRFPHQKLILISAKHVQSLIEDLRGACSSLESLVLRFADVSGPSLDSDGSCLEQLSFDNIKGFLGFKSLRSFAIDHNLPLCLAEDDIHNLSQRAHRFTSLSLNPCPLARNGVPDPPELSISCLSYFAAHCPNLESLALQVNATYGLRYLQPLARFQRLNTFFVGWSEIPVFPGGHERVEGWESVAEFLAGVLARQTELRTVYEHTLSDPMDLVSCDMERRAMLQIVDKETSEGNARAWRSVWAMTRFLQNIRS